MMACAGASRIRNERLVLSFSTSRLKVLPQPNRQTEPTEVSRIPDGIRKPGQRVTSREGDDEVLFTADADVDAAFDEATDGQRHGGENGEKEVGGDAVGRSEVGVAERAAGVGIESVLRSMVEAQNGTSAESDVGDDAAVRREMLLEPEW